MTSRRTTSSGHSVAGPRGPHQVAVAEPLRHSRELGVRRSAGATVNPSWPNQSSHVAPPISTSNPSLPMSFHSFVSILCSRLRRPPTQSCEFVLPSCPHSVAAAAHRQDHSVYLPDHERPILGEGGRSGVIRLCAWCDNPIPARAARDAWHLGALVLVTTVGPSPGAGTAPCPARTPTLT